MGACMDGVVSGVLTSLEFITITIILTITLIMTLIITLPPLALTFFE